MILNIDNHKSLKIYKRDNKDCYLCRIRKKLILKTPEEEIRQAIVNYFIHELNVPESLIDVEVPLSSFDKKASGRVDIIVYSKEDDLLYPLIIIECKESNHPLTDNVLAQIQQYDTILYSKTICITNGNEILFYIWSDENSDYMLLDNIPKYDELLQDKVNLSSFIDEKFDRPDIINVKQDDIDNYISEGCIGEDTSKDYYSLILNLVGLFYDEEEFANPSKFKNNLISDEGLRFTSFGNAAGGNWPGLYRYFLIKDSKNNNQIISFAVMGKGKFVDHPKFGNTFANTYLIVAIDDFEKSHNSLQLSLDKYVNIKEDYYEIWHDGTITIGKQGAAKRQELIDFIKESKKLDVFENRIFLGRLPQKKFFKWSDENVIAFFDNLISYALLRDDFRRIKNKKSTPNTRYSQ